MSINSIIDKTVNDLRQNALRFPLAVTFAFLAFLYWLSFIYDAKWWPENHIDRIFAILAAGYLWFTSAKLFIESRGQYKKFYPLFSICIFLIIAEYIYFAHYGISIFLYMISGLVILLTVAPFLNKNSNDVSFYNFNRDLWLGVFYSMVFSGLFCGSLSLMLLTIDELFGIKIGRQIYGDISAFSFAFLAPYYALSWLPRNFKSMDEAYLPKGIKFILTYILVPASFAYTAILYAYSLKILIQFQLPNGQLSLMISSLGVIGSLVLLAAFPMRSNGPWLVRKYVKYFCFIFLPLIFMLFLAITVRLHDYGITESRYTIILSAIWFLITAIINIIRHDDYSMKYGPAILACMFILASFGPWGAVSMSEKSQVGRLKALMIKNNMFENEKVKAPVSTVPMPDAIAITSIVNYLKNTDKLDAIKNWFEPNTTIYKAGHHTAGEIIKDMGLNPTYGWEGQIKNNGVFNMNLLTPDVLTHVSDYDYFLSEIYLYDNGHGDNNNSNKKTFTLADKRQLVVELNKNKLHVTILNFTTVDFDLAKLLEQFRALPDNSDAMKEKARVIAENNLIKVQLNINSINGNNAGGLSITNLNFNMLLKIK